ncbi:hypothetical protein DICPUDRAFT_79761 [Dictyostelium purpureum]|uniref:BRCT domain-containing protein n=1 Tax=Dictyostelium purpureum TaxID=5786 RepID=F0ZNI1_DICPU|nr:uncharacterized protein DICPUDRAFT_79761 [Dictyostelium purpureum]EGC34490.1 hypothetical protein DICPUDRAFT_79761 [Dictyostelium purpureum]|eukprot:XP_003288979.1 hypothetical protein DICPUDRAFT_79761 [Dictyostelium purpureum]
MLPINSDSITTQPPLRLIDSSVSSCSSESEHYKSINVLVEDTYRVWQTKDKTDKAYIELQFPSPTQIKQIEITNGGSAFIEILVGLVTWEPTEFQVLVPLTNFMTFSESTNKVNRNKTKVFDCKQFSQQTIPRKWERIRIVCTQPWSLDNLGIGSIKIYGPVKKQASSIKLVEPENISMTDTSLNDSRATNTSIETEPTAFKTDSTQVLNFIPAELTKGNSNLGKISKGATLALNNPLPGQVLIISKKSTVNSSNNNNLNNSGTDVSMETKKVETVEIETEEENEEEKTDRINQDQLKKKKLKSNIKENITQQNNVNNENDGETDQEGDNLQILSTPKQQKKLTSFGNLLKGVVLVIGGIVNPQKGELRDKAIEMGAEYKPDWCREATHLVTPFDNTPKFKEAKKAGGSIVNPDWIEDCYKLKSRLPIGKYTFRSNNSEATQSTPKKDKIGKSISTTEKKRKRKGDPTSDDSEDDSHIPNEYDYNDGFIDNSFSSSEKSDRDPDDIVFDKENVNDLLQDGLDYLQRAYHYKPKGEIHHNTHHKKQKSSHKKNNDHDNDGDDNQGSYKSSSSYRPNKYYNEEYDVQKSSSSSPPPIKYKPKPPKAEEFDEDLLFERSNTIQMTAEEVKSELDRIKSNNNIKGTVQEKANGAKDNIIASLGDTDEDNDEKPIAYNKPSNNLPKANNNLGELKDLKGKEYILKPLPSFFDGFEFYLSLKDEASRKSVTRLIIAYKGIISTKPTTNTKFIITDRAWDRSFDITKKNFPNVLFLAPSFVVQSDTYQKLSTVDKHIISKV